MLNDQYSVDDFLAHYGVKGMKWGVRRLNAGVQGGSSKQSARPKDPRKTLYERGLRMMFNASTWKTSMPNPKMRDRLAKEMAHPIWLLKERKYQMSLVRGRMEALRILQESDNLTHYGVKGMRWGVRKSDTGGTLGGSSKGALNLRFGVSSLHESGELDRRATLSRGGFQKRNPDLADKNLSSSEIFKKVVLPINPDYPGVGTVMNCKRCTLSYEMRRRGYDVEATKTRTSYGQTKEGLENATNPNLRVRENHDEIFKKFDSDIQAELGFKPNLTKPDHMAKIAKTKTYHELNRPGDIEFKQNSKAKYFTFSDLASKDKLARKEGVERPIVTPDAVFRGLTTQPNGSRGELGLILSSGGGHSVSYEIVHGKPVIFDTQTKNVYDSAQSLNNAIKTGTLANFGETYITRAGITRLDDKPLNEDYLSRWATDARD